MMNTGGPLRAATARLLPVPQCHTSYERQKCPSPAAAHRRRDAFF